MDVNKNNAAVSNSWVLCPSKSFPGKFYYFNVNNGQAVWSLNSKEKADSKIDNRFKTNHKFTYPEAKTPPTYSPSTPIKIFPNLSQDNTTTASQSGAVQNTPILGQSTPIYVQLPNLTANLQQLHMPNIAWAPIQLPFWPYFFPDTTRTMTESRIERVMDPGQIDRNIFVHTSGMPLCNRFVNYKSPSYNNKMYPEFASSNTHENPKSHMENPDSQMSNYNPEFSDLILNSESDAVINKTKLQSTKLNTLNIRAEQSENELPKYIPESCLNIETEAVKSNVISTQFGTHNFRARVSESIPSSEEPILNLVSYSVENSCQSDPFPKHITENSEPFLNLSAQSVMLQSSQHCSNKSNLMFKHNENSPGKCEGAISSDDIESAIQPSHTVDKSLKYLSSTDLRFHLLAKRKLQSDRLLGHVERKKPKMQEDLQNLYPIKKKVTFNLENLWDTSKSERYIHNFSPIENIEHHAGKITFPNTSTNVDYRLSPIDNALRNISITKNVNLSTKDIQMAQESNRKNENFFENNRNHDPAKTGDIHSNMPYNIFDKQANENLAFIKESIGNNTNSMDSRYIFTNTNYSTNNTNAIEVRKEIINRNKTLDMATKAENAFNDSTNNMQVNQTPIERARFKDIPVYNMGLEENGDRNNNIPNNNNTERILSDENCNKAMKSKYTNMQLKETDRNMTVLFKNSTSANDVHIRMTEKITTPYINRDVWYLVVDLDVLLDDHLLVNNLIKSDAKCILLIPHALRREIEALCIGDYHGQQRVLIARQLSRRITAMHKQIIVEPPPRITGIELNTTEHILMCCVRAIQEHYYVVLVTNDGYLKNRANSLNMNCYTPQDIKKVGIITPELFAELKHIKLSDTAMDKHTASVKNETIESLSNIPENRLKKQLIVKDNSNCNCNILSNITKSISESSPSMPNIDNFSRLEMSNNAKNLNFKNSDSQSTLLSKDGHMQRQVTNNINKTEYEGFEKNTLNLINQRNSILYQKDLVNKNHCANQTNSKENHSNLIDESDTENKMKNGNDKNKKENLIQVGNVITGTKQQIQIYTSSVPNSNCSNLNTQTQKSNRTFMIPKMTPIKNATTETSAPENCSRTSGKVRSNFESSEFNLEHYIIENEQIHEVVRRRMEEFICCYTQIMEELLSDIVQIKMEYLNKMIVSTINIQEALTQIKMIYDDVKLRRIIDMVVELLMKCTSSKGKIQLDTEPKDLLQIIEYSILLVKTLKTIIPHSNVVTDCELYFESLLNNIKSQNDDLNLDLCRCTAIRRSDLTGNNESRFNYTKDKSYIIKYLKKHFKEWADVDTAKLISTNENNAVIRLEGKDINKIKINKNKSVYYSQTSKDNATDKSETKVIKLIENYPLLTNNENDQDQVGSKSRQLLENTQHIVTTDSNKMATHLQNSIDNILRSQIRENNEDLPTNGKMFNHNKASTGPKMILNFNRLTEFKETNQNKEPLNLNLLDNSNSNDHTDSAIGQKSNAISPNQFENADTKDDFNSNESTILTNKIFSYVPQVNDAGVINNNVDYEDINSESYYLNSVNINDIYGSRKNNVYQNRNCNKNEINNNHNAKKDDKSRDNDSNKKEVNNVEMNVNSYRIDDNYRRNDNYAGDKDKCGDTDNNDAGKLDNDIKSQLIHKDDSTIDSGIENESTQAHSLVKSFLSELSITFKVIYNFISDFITESRKVSMCKEKKKKLYQKASRCLKNMVALTQELTSIIQRESNEDTMLRNLFLRAGVEAADDKRITRYRQIIMKCLEQAQIIESSLRIIVCITIGDFNAIPYNSNTISTNMRYFNIFE